jgi:hypothetical protein
LNKKSVTIVKKTVLQKPLKDLEQYLPEPVEECIVNPRLATEGNTICCVFRCGYWRGLLFVSTEYVHETDTISTIKPAESLSILNITVNNSRPYHTQMDGGPNTVFNLPCVMWIADEDVVLKKYIQFGLLG